MATMISSGVDVVTFLKEQHEQIKELFARVNSSSGQEREEAFYSLRRLLAVHETAEEEIVHPAARKALPDGESLIDARLQEENEAKKLLSELEDLEVDSAAFQTTFSTLERAVLAHARAEEELEFARLESVFDQSRLQRMRKAAEFAEQAAPTRPHAGVESQASNILAGPFAAMIDRTRDMFSGKSH